MWELHQQAGAQSLQWYRIQQNKLWRNIPSAGTLSLWVEKWGVVKTSSGMTGEKNATAGDSPEVTAQVTERCPCLQQASFLSSHLRLGLSLGLIYNSMLSRPHTQHRGISLPTQRIPQLYPLHLHSYYIVLSLETENQQFLIEFNPAYFVEFVMRGVCVVQNSIV